MQQWTEKLQPISCQDSTESKNIGCENSTDAAECAGERILKIGHYLTKLWPKTWLSFLGHRVCLSFETVVFVRLAFSWPLPAGVSDVLRQQDKTACGNSIFLVARVSLLGKCQTPLHGHRLRTCCAEPPTEKLTTILQLVVQQICQHRNA